MKIGVSTACYYPVETEVALEIIGKSGIKSTELFFNCQSELKNSFIDILLKIKNEYGLDIVSVHPTMSLAESFMIFSEYERRFNESLYTFERYSEIAARLGANYIIMHGGKPNGILSDEEYCERYMILKERTRKNGVTVLQENAAKFRAGDIEFMHSMRNILGSEAEFCLDIKQAVRSGYIPINLIDEFIDNIHHFHISDHSVSGDCWLPGNGGFDFYNFFKRLKNSGYKGAAIIEVYKNAYKHYDEIINCEKKLELILKNINI